MPDQHETSNAAEPAAAPDASPAAAPGEHCADLPGATASLDYSALAAALAAAQAEIRNPTKNRTVTVRSDKGNYTFSYATLDGIMDAVRGPLAKHGLAILHTLGERRVATILLHRSGQSISISIPYTVGGARDQNQALGSAITYARRYGVICLLGVAAEDDDDGNAADGNAVEAVRDHAPRRAAPTVTDVTHTPPEVIPPAATARPRTLGKADSALRAKQRLEYDHLRAVLVEAMGEEETEHQVGAIKARHRTDYEAILVAMRAIAPQGGAA